MLMTTRQLKQLRRYMPTENGNSMGNDKAMKQALNFINSQTRNGLVVCSVFNYPITCVNSPHDFIIGP